MGVRVTVHGGNREIGGNKILVETGDGGVFLDFGKSYTIEDQFFEVPWNPPFHIPSLLSVGALPDIPGLYRHEPGEHRYAVVVSQPHLDHVGYVPLLSPGTPVITGVDTKNLVDIRLESMQTSWDSEIDHLDWQLLRTGGAVELPDSDIKIIPIHVDHSVPASYGFIVEAGGMCIAYTGDIRMHGARPDLSEDFLNELRAKPVDILLCEGTRVRPAEDPDIKFLQDMAANLHLRMGGDIPQPVQVDCATEHDVRDALEQTMKDSHGAADPIDAEVYTKGREKWEQQLVDDWTAHGGDVYWGLDGRSELRNMAEHYVIVSPSCVGVLPELAYRAHPCDVTFVLSKSEAFNEEMLISFDRMLHWLRLYGCNEYKVIHVSGHASPADLQTVVEAANPNLLVPIHTRFPELMTPWHDSVRVPEPSGVVDLS
ncbi:MAG: hypothetical protein GEU75_06550 [Dehalococcoidia bacterium]|nr:hypothetical protein [Dehalococcoidia bacterium]